MLYIVLHVICFPQKNPTIHLSHVPQYTIWNRNAHTSVPKWIIVRYGIVLLLRLVYEWYISYWVNGVWMWHATMDGRCWFRFLNILISHKTRQSMTAFSHPYPDHWMGQRNLKFARTTAHVCYWRTDVLEKRKFRGWNVSPRWDLNPHPADPSRMPKCLIVQIIIAFYWSRLQQNLRRNWFSLSGGNAERTMNHIVKFTSSSNNVNSCRMNACVDTFEKYFTSFCKFVDAFRENRIPSVETALVISVGQS